MQILIISSKDARHRYLEISNRTLLLSVLLVAMLIWFGWTEDDAISSQTQQGRPLTQSSVQYNEMQAQSHQPLLQRDRPFSGTENVNPVYVKKLGALQAETIRLQALTERIAREVGIDMSAFELSKPPAEGGINGQGDALSAQEMNMQIKELRQKLSAQARHIQQLGSVISTTRQILSALPSGYPIKREQGGWLSSRFGYRIDPFTGKKAFHRGLDFAGKENSDVVAVADGIVLWAGKKQGYGYMVDIDHGNGYVTRYAHNRKLLVTRGQRITKGQTIAKMGTTGRSTGPHVHFEVIKDGHNINPYSFIKG